MSHSSRNILEIFGFLIEICHLLQVQTSLTTAQHTTQLGSNIICHRIKNCLRCISVFKITCQMYYFNKYKIQIHIDI